MQYIEGRTVAEILKQEGRIEPARAAQFTVETTAITPGPIAPAQFDIPPGWKLIPPPAKSASTEFTCPKTGGTG